MSHAKQDWNPTVLTILALFACSTVCNCVQCNPIVVPSGSKSFLCKSKEIKLLEEMHQNSGLGYKVLIVGVRIQVQIGAVM